MNPSIEATTITPARPRLACRGRAGACFFLCLVAAVASCGKPATPARRPNVQYVPTPQDVVERMLQLAEVKNTDVVYDLGCGDGRIVVTAAKKYGAKAVGYDIDPKLVRESLDNVRKNQVEHLVTIEEKDIFTLDLSGADVIAIYLLPQLNVKLIPQFEKLKPGARIVSHSFAMEGVKPTIEERFQSSDGREHLIFLWVTPLTRGNKE